MKKIITPGVREEAEILCDATGRAAVAGLVMWFWYGSSLVHFRNHAGFQQSARRGERDFVRAFVFDYVIPPLFRRKLLFHVMPLRLCGGDGQHRCDVRRGHSCGWSDENALRPG
jgi:hypothetical protein